MKALFDIRFAILHDDEDARAEMLVVPGEAKSSQLVGSQNVVPETQIISEPMAT